MSLISRSKSQAPEAWALSPEESRVRQEVLLLQLTVAITPVTLLCWLLMPGRDPGLALSSQLIIPLYVVAAGGAARRRPQLLTTSWLRALLLSLQISLVVLQVWAYDSQGSALWLAFLPALLAGALRWEFRGVLIAMAVFTADRIASVATFPHLTATAAARELILELTVMTLLGVVVGFLFRELERYRDQLRGSLSRLASSTGALSAVLENVGEAILTVDAAGRVASANWAAGDLFACKPDTLVGSPLDHLLSAPGIAVTDLTAAAGCSRRCEATGRRRDGTGFSVELVVTLLVGDGGALRTLVLRDVTELRAKTAALSHQARHDGLTGLPNRLELTEQLLERLAVARATDTSFSVLFVDLDGFKRVNDTRGHSAGDDLLRFVAERLRTQMRASDLVARLGGDEFAILPGDATSAADVERIAEKVVDAFRDPFRIGGDQVAVGVSIGIARFPEHGVDADTLMRQADGAMYTAKRTGQGWSVAGAVPDAAVAASSIFLPDLRRAVEDGELELRCTPMMGLRDGVLAGIDAEPRWNHPQLGPLDADRFLHLAEASGVIRPLVRNLARLVIEQQARWWEKGFEIRASIRLHRRNLDDSELASVVAALLRDHHLPPSSLTLLVDTTCATLSGAKPLFDAARDHGIQLGIDDFGADLPDLGLLTAPFSELRLHASVAARLTAAGGSTVQGIVDTAHAQGMVVVAKGVADQATLDRLRELHSDAVTFARWDQELSADAIGTPLSAELILAVLSGSQQTGGGPPQRNARAAR